MINAAIVGLGWWGQTLVDSVQGTRQGRKHTGLGRVGEASRSQTERAFCRVREMLLRGEIGGGARISEVPLTARLGMSRTPLRLALERLAHIGFLDVCATGGFTVRQFTVADVLDAIEIRGVLEGTAARLAAERLTHDAELDALRRHCEQMETLGHLTMEMFSDYIRMNDAFHSAVIDLAKSAMSRRTLEHANSLPFASPSAMAFAASVLPTAGQTLAMAHAHHRGIVEAIGQRQGTRAESVAREHALSERRVLERALSKPGGLGGRARGIPRRRVCGQRGVTQLRFTAVFVVLRTDLHAEDKF